MKDTQAQLLQTQTLQALQEALAPMETATSHIGEALLRLGTAFSNVGIGAAGAARLAAARAEKREAELNLLAELSGQSRQDILIEFHASAEGWDDFVNSQIRQLSGLAGSGA